MFDQPIRNVMEQKKFLTASPETTVSDAARLMASKNAGAVLVLTNDCLVGIFTERDIVRCVFNNIPDNETIAGLTKRDITIFDPSTAVSAAISIASRKKVRHLPVVEDGRIIGMVTFRDLVSYMLPEISFMAEAAH